MWLVLKKKLPEFVVCSVLMFVCCTCVIKRVRRPWHHTDFAHLTHIKFFVPSKPDTLIPSTCQRFMSFVLLGIGAVFNLRKMCVEPVVDLWFAVAGDGKAPQSARALIKDTRERSLLETCQIYVTFWGQLCV